MPKDPQCPLGFHPQVRWPTRCKRCFREFKDHIVSKDEPTYRSRMLDSEVRTPTPQVSVEEYTPRSRPTSSLGSNSSTSTSEENQEKDFSSPYSSISSTALNRLNKYREGETKQRPSSVTVVSETLTLPQGDGPLVRRRRTTDLSDTIPEPATSQSSNSTETVTIRLRKQSSIGSSDGSSSETSSSSLSSPTPPPSPRTPRSSPSPSHRIDVTKDYGPSISPEPGKKTAGADFGSTAADSAAKPKKTKKKRLLIQGVTEVPSQPQPESNANEPESPSGDSSADVAFIIQVKSTGKKKKIDDDDETMSMTTTTDTTETTLVDLNETVTGGMSSWEVEDMKMEVKRLREKCDKVEREKAEILSRRVASLDAPRAQSSEYLKLQQKVNQLTSLNEDLKDEQKSLESRVRELESDLSNRPTTEFMQRSMGELRTKLSSAETQIDQLQDEKRDAIRQMQDMQEEFEEMQDGFREEQSEEFASLKKELDDASKNCRLLQFKLRKVEKRCDQLEAEKKEVEQRLETSSNSTKVLKLEEELKKAKQENERLKSKDKDTLSVAGGLKKKSPVLTKAPSGEKVEPPMPPDFDAHKTLRDLQSALERESDIREQLKFAEEEAGTLRQKISRIEDENESLLIQIKKMSSKSRTDLSNKGKAETGRLGQPPPTENGEKLDAIELKLQLELNEQESKILRKKVEDLEKSNTKLNKDLQKAEDKMTTLEHATPFTKSKSVDEVTLLRRKLIEKEREIERLQTEVTNKLGPKGKMLKSKSLEVQESNMRLDAETKAELKKVQDELGKLQTESEKQKGRLEDDLAKAQRDVESHQDRVKQVGESNKQLSEQIEGLKRDLKTMKDHYETIQEEFVIKNSKLSTTKEEIETDLQKLKREHDTIDRELRALRETFNNRQDTWIKEKLGLEQKIRDSEISAKKLLSIPGDKDTVKLKSLLKQQQSDLDTRTRELTDSQDRIIQMQKENDQLKGQLEDFDKVAQVQLRSLQYNKIDPTIKSDKEIKTLQERITAVEKLHKTEVAQMKMRHEQLVAMKAEEITTVQHQLSRAKRERDTFRQMVDSAQRAIAELKSRGPSSGQRESGGLEEAAAGAQAAMGTLQERVASLEDDLTEARRETSHAKTEMVTEKSQWEMKIGEMQQKINELEEEKLLSGSGRVRGSSVLGRTRLELAWQKEREEQQRRLKEATTLARDLKTTLLEIERERDREKVEAKRRVDQLKATMEEEQEDVKRKLGESQCDLLELRDAHAKLRTANEKLRKDREKLETQRESQIKKELEIRKVRIEREKILDQLISRVAALNPTSSNSNLSQQPPKMSFAEVLHFLQNIKSLTEPDDVTNPREKRRSHFKKASSLGENDGPDVPTTSRESLQSMPGGSSSYGLSDHYGAAGRGQRPYFGSVSSTLTLPSRARTPGEVRKPSSSSSSSNYRSNQSDSGGASSAATFNPRGSLYRKALSLEQTVAMPDEQRIWKGQSETGSGSSIGSMGDGQYSRGSSMERMSTVSSKSEKPKGLMGKMKNLVKSKSIEESSSTAANVVRAGVQAAGVGSNQGSDLSLNTEERDSKSLKDKMKGMFKRSTRSPSVERTTERKLPTSTLQFQPTTTSSRPSRDPTPSRDSSHSREARDAREGTPNSMSTQRPLMPSTQRPLMPSQNLR